jgi:hypothetical protein
MKAISTVKEEEHCPDCNWKTNRFFQLSGWDKNNWICGLCFAEEMIEGDYTINPDKHKNE